MLPKVAVFALGGTIASSTEPGGAAKVGLSGADLLRSVPGADTIADLDVHTVALVPSGDLRLTHLLKLRDAVERAIHAGAGGVVVTQGTDTMEETAYAFDLLTSFDEPVVFTGAMRNSSALSADGPANVMAAITVAAAPAARAAGVLVVLNDELHSARQVRKLHTSSTAAFVSPLTGPIGYLVEGQVRVLTRPAGRVTIDLPPELDDARVALITIGFEDDTALIDALPDLGYDGVVIAAFGGGHVPSWTVPSIEQIARRIPTVLASRTAGGEVLHNSYGYPGSETDLLARGLISAGDLAAVKARILLRLLLTADIKPDQLPHYFTHTANPNVTTNRRHPR